MPLSKLRLILCSFTSLVLSTAFAGQPAPEHLNATQRWSSTSVVGRGGMVVSEDRLASQVGAHILEQGGNAVDAAVAVGFALAVTLPKAGNLGGGGFMLIHRQDLAKTTAIDYRETAPARASRDMYLEKDGNVDQHMLHFTVKSTAIPGTVAGMLLAQKKYGTFPLAKVLQPAIDLAEKGFTVSPSLAKSLARYADRLKRSPESKRIFFHANGQAYRAGETMRRPDLAWTLTRILLHGRKGFYQGEVASRLIASVQKHGGLITRKDLLNYRAIERPVLWATFGKFRLATMPPPSSGGVDIIEIMNILSHFPLKKWGPDQALTISAMAEAMRTTFADRSKFLGDPDFVKVPVAALTSPEYAAAIARQIKPGHARKSSDVEPGKLLPYESPQTTHFSTADRWGNMVSNTYTLNFNYGSGHTATGTGIVLNNEMDDFSAKPGVPNAYGLLGGEANSIRPGKRPLSSMTPTLVFRNGAPWLATGSPGGSTIITTVLQMIVNTTVFDMNVAQASNWPRFHHQWYPDKIFLEPGISRGVEKRLWAMGYATQRRHALGNTQSIMIKNGLQYGAADPRYPGNTAVAARLLTPLRGTSKP